MTSTWSSQLPQKLAHFDMDFWTSGWPSSLLHRVPHDRVPHFCAVFYTSAQGSALLHRDLHFHVHFCIGIYVWALAMFCTPVWTTKVLFHDRSEYRISEYGVDISGTAGVWGRSPQQAKSSAEGRRRERSDRGVP